MNVPDSLAEVERQDAVVRRFDRDGSSGIVVDFGPEVDETAVDVLEDTVIVLAGDDQFEFDLPDGASDVTVNNGVLTIVD